MKAGNMSMNEQWLAILKLYNKNGMSNNTYSPSNLLNLTSSVSTQHSPALIFYAVSTLVILVVGIVGNAACIHVLINKKVLRQSSAQYFFVFCIFDILVLIFYVMPEWAERALYRISDMEIFRWNAIPGVCQLFLLLAYWLRLVSVWTLAAYSVDRYMGLKKAQYRHSLCGSHYNIKVLAFITLISLFISIWKPYLSRTVVSGSQHSLICGGNSSSYINFIFDIVYACLMSVLPSILIVVMNILIAAHIWNFRCRNSNSHVTRQDLVAMKFAVLLVLISSSFIFLSWPYFAMWIHSWLLHSYIADVAPSISTNLFNNAESVRLICRVLFYLHFGINFFLYSLASKYFKYQIKTIFSLRSLRNKSDEYYNHR